MKRTKLPKPNPWRGKVSRNARKDLQSEPNQKQQLQSIKELYNRTKQIHFKLNPNMNGFRGIRKEFVYSGLSLTARGLYPVLCYLSDFGNSDPKQVSRENIGKLAGIRNWRSIDRAIEELVSAGWVEATKTEHKQRRFWIYTVDFVRDADIAETKHKDWFPFATSMIECGVWAQLTSRAKVFYLGLRCVSEFLYDDYPEISFADAYRNRDYEYAHLDNIRQFCKSIGIDNSKLYQLYRQLYAYGLIEWEQEGIPLFKVRIHSKILTEVL